MKNKMKYLAIVVLMAGAWLPLSAQTDTITQPRKKFQDPKATDENSKVLIDTSESTKNLVDSLLEDGKVKDGKNNHRHATPGAVKQDKMVKQPADKAKVKKP